MVYPVAGSWRETPVRRAPERGADRIDLGCADGPVVPVERVATFARQLAGELLNAWPHPDSFICG